MTHHPVPDERAWEDEVMAKIADAVVSTMESAQAEGARLVLVAPPFASPDRPSLGLHVLASIAQQAGWPTAVVYANLSFARLIGPKLYRALCHTPTQDLIGERLFRLAYGRIAAHGRGETPASWSRLDAHAPPPFPVLQRVAAAWARTMAGALAGLPAAVIGVSTVFEQTMASLALLEGIKAHAPDKRTLIGGANADEAMGLGLADFAPEADHIFQGEAEASLLRFITAFDAGDTDVPRVLPGALNTALDALPPPDYATFFAQFRATVHEDICPGGLDTSELRLPYESSRGCWWGAKHHCTFCGLNANGMTHRIKDADKVAREIATLSEAHGIDRILMVDNIMPHGYFSTLLPQLAAAEHRMEVFYEQKANLSRERMVLLKAAGVTTIQPGIESLSTSLLRRMRKGSTAQVNLDCLRLARAAGVRVAWNLLSDFPGDTAEDYETMIALVPALHHLQPPGGVGGLSIDRFSPYHSTPRDFGIRSIAPLEAYAEVFPGTDDPRLAYHFSGDYDSAVRSRPELYDSLSQRVDDWDAAWANGDAPLLMVFDLSADRHLVTDTRSVAADPCRLVDATEAHMLLRGTHDLTPAAVAALDRLQLVEVDGRYGAIACADLGSCAWEDSPSRCVSEEAAE